MQDEARAPDPTDGDYVQFVLAGTSVVGAYRCSGCGYGVTLRAPLPVCPLCAGTTWEQGTWSPFARAAR